MRFYVGFGWTLAGIWWIASVIAFFRFLDMLSNYATGTGFQ
jgi:hypothetical protein